MAKKEKTKTVLPFIKGRKPIFSKDVIDQGKIGGLDYKVFKRGNLHISSNGYVFKKDCELFEEEVKALDLNKMQDGDEKRIKGCGDNDDLVFVCKNDDIVMKLERKEYGTLNKLKKILRLGKKSKQKEDRT